MRIICISGKAQHGKDTTANLLRQRLRESGHTVLISHYADLLKYICTTFFGWNGLKDAAGRSLLQYVGTDKIRRQSPDFLVDFLIGFFKIFENEWEYVILPDCRFPNEIERFKEDGFDVTSVRVNRPGYTGNLTPEQMAHPSETALDDFAFDYVLMNNSVLPDLKAKVDSMAADLLGR